MISPRIDRLLTQVDSNYASVIVAAKRARQINSYYHNLGEGTFDEFPPPMVDSASKNYLTIALEEVAEGKLKYHYRYRAATGARADGADPPRRHGRDPGLHGAGAPAARDGRRPRGPRRADAGEPRLRRRG